MLVLIDGDLVAYRCAASCTDSDPLDVAIHRADKLTHEILNQTNAMQYKMFLSGDNNFRYIVNPDYKSNRKNQERPKYLEDVREFLAADWKAKIINGWETDDQLGIEQDSTSTIASLDKDLRMIPGRHFSWEIGTATWIKPAEFVTVNWLDGLRTFYKQMLIGDTTDGISGVDGIGKVKAARLIDPLDTELEMFEAVLNKYNNDLDRFIMNAMCLWIMQNNGETYCHRDLTSIKRLLPEVEAKCESMKSLIPMNI